MVLPYLVYLICIGNNKFTYKRQMRLVPYKNILKKYIKSYFKQLKYKGEFKYYYSKYLI